MKIYRLLSAHVVRQSESPLTLLITADGLAATGGWSNVRLDPDADPTPDDAIIELSFLADRPGGIVPQVLTPVSASLVFEPKHGADAVIVGARTNSITVHASEFMVPIVPGWAQFTTLAIGEETPPTTAPRWEEGPTTFALGEEEPPTTRAIGEEGPTFPAIGGEGPTTFRWGEEEPSTFRLGEEEPITDPRVDDPIGPRFTTHLVGEEGTASGGVGPGGGPFGGF